MSAIYYLHENGDLIYKPHAEVCDLRDSDFVRAFWFMDTSNRETAWTILVEASALGASHARIKELADKWGCSSDDAERYAERIGAALTVDGDQYCATVQGFTNLQESPAGFGDTGLEALADLAKELGYSASKMWGASFKDLVKQGAQA